MVLSASARTFIPLDLRYSARFFHRQNKRRPQAYSVT